MAEASQIHSTSVVSPDAHIEEGVRIGPWCVVEAGVTLRKGVQLHSHVVVDGITEIGEASEVYPFTVLGTPPQHLKFRGEGAKLHIGRGVIIRENCAIHRGIDSEHGVTTIRDGAFVMALVHIGHDCTIGHEAIVSSGSMLGGGVSVGANAFLGGGCAVHQHVRIGRNAIIGGMSAVPRDVLPFAMTGRDDHNLIGVNQVGMRRRGYRSAEIVDVHHAYNYLFHQEDPQEDTFRVRREGFIAEHPDKTTVCGVIAEFIEQPTKRGYMQLAKKLNVSLRNVNGQ